MELVETYTFGGYLSVTELPENVVGRIETCRRHSKRRWEASTKRHLWYKRRSWSDKMSLTRRLWCRRCRYQVTQKQKLSYDANATEPEKYFNSRTSKNVCLLIIATWIRFSLLPYNWQQKRGQRRLSLRGLHQQQMPLMGSHRKLLGLVLIKRKPAFSVTGGKSPRLMSEAFVLHNEKRWRGSSLPQLCAPLIEPYYKNPLWQLRDGPS